MSLHSIFTGRPQTISDETGDWRSSIFREPVLGAISLGWRGLEGDEVADRVHHGRPGQAVCIHPFEHYEYWNDHYGLRGETRLGPGSVGENWTVTGLNEQTVCIGDIVSVGSATVQISGPRGPCSKQERKLRLPGFLKQTMATLRTGFYVRVLEPGLVQAGDEWKIKSRSQDGMTVHLVNVNYFRNPDPKIIDHLLAVPELSEEWKQMLLRKRLAG
jgi:MOSC domain-containing protein YiiM